MSRPFLRPHLTFRTVSVPFRHNDLFLWQQQMLRFRDDCKKVVQTFWGILRLYDPTWAEVQQLLELVLALDEYI